MRTSTWALAVAAVLALSGCSVSVTSEPSAGRAGDVAPAAVTAPATAGGRDEESPATDARALPPTSAPSTSAPSISAGAVGVPSADAPTERPSEPSVAAVPTPSGEAESSPAPEPSGDDTDERPVGDTVEEEPAEDGLRQGDSGPEVLALQRDLSELGYWTGGADGSFGALTTQAVMALQKAAGIDRDGVVGPDTEGALAAGTWPQAREGGDGVEIDLDRQLLLVVRDGSVVMALNTSTGVPGTHDTPRGQFQVERAIDGLRVAPLGELWRPRYFHRGYAVHGSPSIPAHPASHGCARLSNAAMNMVWAEDLMPIGSTVAVY